MARIFVLDASPLMLACRARGASHGADAARFADWRSLAMAKGARVVVPAVADFEVRRKLIHLGDRAALGRLDDLVTRLEFLEIAPGVLRDAARLWAEARASGRPLGGDRDLGADAILAAQALRFAGAGDRLTVITENRAHLAPIVDAGSWKDITP